LYNLGGLICFGNVACSPFLLGHCAGNGVGVSFLSENGRFLARVQGPVSGNVLLRREQYRRADAPDASAKLARAFVIGKAANARNVLQRAARDHAEKGGAVVFEAAVLRLARILDGLKDEHAVDEVRGREGDAGRVYFEAFDELVTAQKQDFFFRERSRRPPLDKLNALLSFVYTLLAHDCVGALEGVGLDPQVGFLHRDRPGRPSLALDLMEEFRPAIADRVVLSLVNLRQVQGGGFRTTESGAVEMDDETRKAVLVAYQKRKQEEIRHPFIDETVPVGLLPHVQALLLARHLRGDLDGYPPFLWK
jgi:CRISPR-associated protein Cas1